MKIDHETKQIITERPSGTVTVSLLPGDLLNIASSPTWEQSGILQRLCKDLYMEARRFAEAEAK